jgi:hypothetical protein
MNGPSEMMEFNDGPKICLVVDAYRLDYRRACRRALDLAVLVCTGQIKPKSQWGWPIDARAPRSLVQRRCDEPKKGGSPGKTFPTLTGHWSEGEGPNLVAGIGPLLGGSGLPSHASDQVLSQRTL